MNRNELHCPRCGARLALRVSYDGMGEEAVLYTDPRSRAESLMWGWLIALECTECSAVYPLARTNSVDSVSLILRS